MTGFGMSGKCLTERLRLEAVDGGAFESCVDFVALFNVELFEGRVCYQGG